jgi:hypothetical protein
LGNTIAIVATRAAIALFKPLMLSIAAQLSSKRVVLDLEVAACHADRSLMTSHQQSSGPRA